MTDELLTGKQVLFLLSQEVVPEIETRPNSKWKWALLDDDAHLRLFSSSAQFRIKPAPKPDVVCEGLFGHYNNGHLCYHVSSGLNANLRLTFDGETGDLKSAEVL